MGHDIALAISVDGRPRAERDEPSRLSRWATRWRGRRYRRPAATAARHAVLDARGSRTPRCAHIRGPDDGDHAPRTDIRPRHRGGDEHADVAGHYVRARAPAR